MRAPRLFALLLGSLTALHAADDPALPDGLYAEFTTPPGVFLAELHYARVPLTVANFVGLAEGTLGPRQDTPYYTGLKWYRVVPGFVIQSGNPLAPVDRDAGYTFPDEFAPGLRHDGAGILSMANGGPDTNSGEFFVTLDDCTPLNYGHSVFGRVVRGLEILPRIKPDDPFSIKILRRGAAARAFKADAVTFNDLAAAAKKYTAAAEPGPAAHFDDPDKLLPAEPPRASYFNFKLANFERATGMKIAARLFAKAPPEAEDKVPGAYMRALAEKLGVAKRGALVACFAAEDDWRVWIGDETTSVFLGRTPAPTDLAEGAAFHVAKEAFLNAAHAAGEASFARRQKAAPAGKPLTPAQHLKLQADAVLDGLIFKLEPKPRS